MHSMHNPTIPEVTCIRICSIDSHVPYAATANIQGRFARVFAAAEVAKS